MVPGEGAAFFVGRGYRNVTAAGICVVSYRDWAQMISPGIDGETLGIILNNLFVAFLLWAAAWFWRYCAGRLFVPRSRMFGAMYFVYGFFFLKEFVRMACQVYGFSYSFGLSCGAVFCTLVLPHGLLEFLAFALVAFYACGWLRGERGVGAAEVLLPALILVVAGILETTLTDYLFKGYLLEVNSIAGVCVPGA